MKVFKGLLCIGVGIALGACGDKDSSSSPAPLPTERPHNAACVATTSSDAEPRAFASLDFGSVITGLYQVPGQNSHWFITTKDGLIARFENDPDASDYTVISGAPQVSPISVESGLLAMAFHPAFASNGYVYVSYNGGELGLTSHVTRYTLNGTSLTEPVEIITLEREDATHNGGHLEFGPDGYLYVAFGDGGLFGDFFGNGQNPLTLHSKMLRLDVDGGTPYRIPADNPFVGNSDYSPEIFAMGFRNPWRWSFDRETGDIWLGDVGQASWEEVNKVQAGANYGWPVTEGKHCQQSPDCNTEGLTPPVWEYSHDDGCSITGGFVYRGAAVPALNGYYLYGDYCARGLKGFLPSDPAASFREFTLWPAGEITSLGQGNQGEILIGTGSGKIFQITTSDLAAETTPQLLSQHPCVENAASQQFSAGVIPYFINSELWSDGAEKSRFMALPDDKLLAVDSSSGDISFPVGSVLIKQFNHNNKPVETRFMMHHAAGWASYSYEWNDEGTDAVLSVQSHTKIIDDNYTHIFPSPAQCFRCHTQAAGVTLGPETAQLNRRLPQPSEYAGANQIDALIHMDLFANEMDSSTKKRMIPAIDDKKFSLEKRARAYLHSNCSGCHRPQGYPSHMDLRYDTPLASTGLCNVEPNLGTLGITDAKLLVPGNASLSMIYQRMTRSDLFRMPPLATAVQNERALKVIEKWINGLTTCPP